MLHCKIKKQHCVCKTLLLVEEGTRVSKQKCFENTRTKMFAVVASARRQLACGRKGVGYNMKHMALLLLQRLLLT